MDKERNIQIILEIIWLSNFDEFELFKTHISMDSKKRF